MLAADAPLRVARVGVRIEFKVEEGPCRPGGFCGVELRPGEGQVGARSISFQGGGGIPENFGWPVLFSVVSKTILLLLLRSSATILRVVYDPFSAFSEMHSGTRFTIFCIASSSVVSQQFRRHIFIAWCC